MKKLVLLMLGCLLLAVCAGPAVGRTRIHPAIAAVSTARVDPVVAGTHGGRVVKRWSLDDGAFATAPAPGLQPRLTEAAALRLGRAAIDALHGSAEGFATLGGAPRSLVVGFGLVTVRRGIVRDRFKDPAAHLPLPSFVNRPSWIVAASVTPCCAKCPVSTQVRRPLPVQTWNYEVIAIDATTGTAALQFDERANNPCPPGPSSPTTVSLGMLATSLPWSLGPRSHGRQRIEVAVSGCTAVAGTGGGSPDGVETVGIDGYVPFGHLAACGPAGHDTETVDIAQRYKHEPVGLEVAPNPYFRPTVVDG